MKVYLVLIAAVSLAYTGCQMTKAQSGPIQIEGIREAYAKGGMIEIVIKNLSQDVLHYGVGVEERKGAEWTEVVPNVEEEVYKPEYAYRPLGPGETRKIKWLPEKVPPFYGLAEGEYRYAVAFSEKTGVRWFRSGSFWIRGPKQ
jgi:hypothetical protein